VVRHSLLFDAIASIIFFPVPLMTGSDAIGSIFLERGAREMFSAAESWGVVASTHEEID
jgi:hypothetical protein